MRRTVRILWVLNVAFPFIVILSLWLPILYVYKGAPQLNFFRGASSIPTLLDDRAIALLKTVNGGALTGNTMARPSDVVAAAEQLLLGKIDLSVLGIDTGSLGHALVFRPPFDDTLVFRGDSSWQLAYSGFLVPSIFLRAFDATGREEFLAAARDFILGWWNFEQRALLPEGLLWNDHAIASRAIVLSEFWYSYRHHTLFSEPDAQAVIALVENTARLLSRKRLYTYRTNHGFMQNIGLAKISLSFSGMRKMDEYNELAFQRMLEQIDYYFGAEGMVLEHSPGYHVFGMELLDDMIALMDAAGRSVPASVTATREKALTFLWQILRPDGTLPRVGDTHPGDALARFPDRVAAWVGEAAVQGVNGRSAAVIFGKSAYAIHRMWVADRGTETRGIAAGHLTAFWGYLPYMGHKHADELSLHLWASGTDWWTAVGYWPFTRNDRDRAICWDGSNAPHRVGEPCGKSERTARALGTAHNETGFALDLLREGPDGFRVRRQILSLTSGVWLTLDSFDDVQQRRARVVWLSGPMNSVVRSGTNFYRLESSRSPDGLAVQFLASEKTPVRFAFGETGSTTGWVVDGGVRRAPAFVVELPSKDSWSLNVSILEAKKQARFVADARMIHWRGPEAWKIAVPLQEGTLTIERTGGQILVHDNTSGAPASLTMNEIPASDQVDQAAFQSYSQAESRYGKPFKPYIKYRVRVTWVLMILALFHFVYLLGLSRLGDRLRLYGLIAPVVCWPALMTWLFTVYLVA